MKKNLTLYAALLTAIFTAALAGGCGGGGASSPRLSAYLDGELHGALAQALTEQLTISEHDGVSTERMLFVSKPDGSLRGDAADASAKRARAALDAGQIVALEHVNQLEINDFLSGMEMEPLNILQSPDAEANLNNAAEIFAMERRGGHNFFFVAISDGNVILSPDSREEYSYTVSGDFEAKDGKVIAASRNVSADWPEAPADGETARGRVAEFLDWAASGAKRLAALEEARDGAEDDLKELAEACVWDVNCSESGQSFTLRYTIYSCHSFSQNQDYYLVSQSAQLNPSTLWKRTQEGHVNWPNIYEPKQEGHMRRYIFRNYWGTSPGGSSPLVKNSPENANETSTVTSGFSWSASGSIGFAGMSGTGSLSGGVSYSSSQSFNISDCKVNNNCGGEGLSYLAKWEYDLADPANGDPHFYWSELRDAPLLARSNFQPVNQWVWVVPRSFSDAYDNLSFGSEFKWTNGKSEGQINCFYIKAHDAVHRDWMSGDVYFWVPVKKPPLLVLSLSQLDFTKSGESKSLTFVSAKDWKAESGQSWCSIEETAGGATGSQGITLHVTAAPNESGANREAVVTLKSTDGKESCKLKISLSLY